LHDSSVALAPREFVPADTNRVVAREIVNVQETPVHNPIMMRAGMLNRL
jgi:hypothetical protein